MNDYARLVKLLSKLPPERQKDIVQMARHLETSLGQSEQSTRNCAELSSDEAWELLRKEMRDIAEFSEQRFQTLPPAVQRALGSSR